MPGRKRLVTHFQAGKAPYNDKALCGQKEGWKFSTDRKLVSCHNCQLLLAEKTV